MEHVWDLFNRLDADEEVRNASRTTQELLETFTEDAQFLQPAALPGNDVYDGREGIRDGWNVWFDLWAEHRSEILEIAEHDDRVFVHTRNTLIGRDGIAVEFEGSSTLTFRGAQIVRFENSLDVEAARRALEAGG